MFLFALLIGIYSYSIFILGLFSLLYPQNLFYLTIAFIMMVFLVIFLKRKKGLHTRLVTLYFFSKKDPLLCIFLMLLALQIIINFIGSLGPETAFDALWYHLTLPKIFLQSHKIFHVPGGLLYYSDMPKLGEMLYIPALAFGTEITAKLIHFSFGLLTLLALYFLSRKFFSIHFSLIMLVIFSANLVVAWEVSDAYIDVIRTFFEVMALWGFMNWVEVKKQKWLILSACMVGLAITTKLLAITSLIIFCILIGYICFVQKNTVVDCLKKCCLYIFIALLIPLPWFIFSYHNTGNPFYPLFSPIFISVHEKVFDFTLFNPIHFVSTFWDIFVTANDPISPLYLMILPLIFVIYKKVTQKETLIYMYSLLALLFWYPLSSVEGTRLLLPYLPAMSFVVVSILRIFSQSKQKTKVYIFRYMLIITIMISFLSIGYRFIANSKYIPVIIGKETTSTFLTNHLNFAFGDFYDTDHYFATTIKNNDSVLLYGFHNLYYVDFPYIDASWVAKGDRFNYIAVQNAQIPKRFANWKLVYTNPKTLVKLYKPANGFCKEKCIY